MNEAINESLFHRTDRIGMYVKECMSSNMKILRIKGRK